MRSLNLATLAIGAGIAPTLVDAFWRMECRGVAGVARIDPLMQFGKIGSHMHTIFGSGGFSETATYDDLVSAECTSCGATQDKSAYWTPTPFFQDASTGEFTRVPNVGGMLAYYKLTPDLDLPVAEQNLTAFPKEFRMIAGDNFRRNYTLGDVNTPDPPTYNWAALGQTSQDDLAQRAIGFNCLSMNPNKAEAALLRHVMPTKEYIDANCDAGVRFELQFPMCGNGQADSLDHKSHVAYPDLVVGGACPAGFPIRYPSLFYETIWNFNAFSDKQGTFVISNGDPEGFGYHGDFMMGWDEGVLQKAVDTCTNESGLMQDCAVFDIQSQDVMQECNINIPGPLVNENVATPLTALPGGIQIQSGPEPATPPAGAMAGNAAATSAPAAPAASATSAAAAKPTLVAVPPPPVAAPATSAASAANKQPDTDSSTSAPAPAPAPTTLKPSPVIAAPSAVNAVSTSAATNGAVVEEIVYEEEIVYVTEEATTTVYVEPTAASKKRRDRRKEHVNMHRHVHGRRH